VDAKQKKPRDGQYIYMPGGGYVIQKLMMQVPIDHLQRFKEMICTAEALPAGDMPPPNKAPWLGNPLEIPQNSAIIQTMNLLNSRIFIGI
jgi:hypothetical protein